MKRYFVIKDSLGNFVRSFRSYKAASEFKFTYGNYNWIIKEIIIK